MEHATAYGGDPSRIGLTGDSAGGHLAAFASLATNMIGSRGFGREAGVFEFKPTYLPKNKTVDQLRTDMTASRRGLEGRHCAAHAHSQGF